MYNSFLLLTFAPKYNRINIFYVYTNTCYYRRFRLGLCTHSDGKSDENQQSCSCFVDVCFLLGSLYGRPLHHLCN